MPRYPSCAKCSVCDGVSVVLGKYQVFQSLIDQSIIERLTDHSRGFMRGQQSILGELIDDLGDLVPYLEIERQFTRNGKGE